MMKIKSKSKSRIIRAECVGGRGRDDPRRAIGKAIFKRMAIVNKNI
jgi:hypothetical protein